MNYTGKIAVFHQQELILGNAVATLTVRQEGRLKEWSVSVFNKHIDHRPFSIAQHKREVVELTFVQDNGEKYTGHAFIAHTAVGVSGVEVLLTGTGKLNGYEES